MQTTFRNLEISNKLLDLNITDDVFQDAKLKYSKYHSEKITVPFHYIIRKPTYQMSVSLSKPPYSYNGDQVVKLETTSEQKIPDSSWFEIGNIKTSFVPSEDDITKMHFVDSMLRNNHLANKNKIHDTVQEIKNNYIENIRNRVPDQENYGTVQMHYNSMETSLTQFVEHVNWLYDATLDTKGLLPGSVSILANKFKEFDWEVIYYYKVVDIQNNHRLALVARLGDLYGNRNYGGYRSYGKHGEAKWTIYDIPHDNPAYNYIDAGTFAYNINNVAPGSVQFDTSVTSLPKGFGPLEHYLRNKKDPVVVIDQTIIDKANKKYMLKKALEKDDEQKKKLLKTKINSRIENIATQPLKLNEAVFSGNQIEYSGQILRSDLVDIKELLRRLYRFHDLDDINYDRAFEMFITELIRTTMREVNKDIKARIGDIDITLHQKFGVNKANTNYAVYYINNVRINKDEFEPVLQRAACFEDVKLYNKFLKQVSECSLKIHGLLDRGIDVTVNNPLKRERITLKIQMVRKNKRQYLKIGNNVFLIKNTPRIVNLPKKDYLDDVIDVLLNPDNVDGVTAEDLKTLVIQAKQAYTDAIEKSKMLLESTVSKFHLQQVEVDIKNSKKRGYIVPGKVKTYFVEYNGKAESSKCGVYTYPDMNYVCIVDKTPNQQVGVDNFVNRIYALANDKFLAKQISTLNIQQ